MLRKTKIVATIGPVTENQEMMEKLVKAGLNMARLNFSHGTHEEHQNRLNLARAASEKFGVPVAVMQDLSGPKIRIGDFHGKESVNLQKGTPFILTVGECLGDEKRVSVNYKNLNKELAPGSTIMLNDGRNRLVVKKIVGEDIHCIVEVGGEIKGRRGVNLPGAYLKISALTDKDKKDLEFGIKNKVDFMALSFVRTAKDVLELKDILKKKKASDIKIIVKLETAEAMENLDEIIAATDGVMVARGDLAVEVPAEQVPFWQKKIIEKCNNAGKPVITATHMLDTMINSPVPTRAEVSDIANAILDGTDAVMLSGETTLGKYPVECVETMDRVARYTEENFDYKAMLTRRHLEEKEIADSISFSVVNTAHNIGAKAIVVFTEKGFTARMISRHKPQQPIYCRTCNKGTYNRLALSSGCYPILSEHIDDSIEEAIKYAKSFALKNKIAKKGETIVISAGLPFGEKGTTNSLIVGEL